MATTTKAIQIKSGSTWYTLCPFPVGFIYMSYSNSSPASIYGGSWSTMTDGRYFRIHNSSTTRIGGSSTIKTENLPSHTHTPSRRTFVQPNTGLGNATFTVPGNEMATYGWLVDNGKTTGGTPTGATGGGQAFYPTYQDVYVWRRTA